MIIFNKPNFDISLRENQQQWPLHNVKIARKKTNYTIIMRCASNDTADLMNLLRCSVSDTVYAIAVNSIEQVYQTGQFANEKFYDKFFAYANLRSVIVNEAEE